MDHLHSLDIVR